MDTNSSKGVVTNMGIDIGKNAFHVFGMDAEGAIVRRQKLSRAKSKHD